MDINRILFLLAALNLSGDLYNVYRYRARLPLWIKSLVAGALFVCGLSWFVANDISGYISAGVLAIYLIIMRTHSKRKSGRRSLPWPATKILIALNCIGFGVQLYFGAATDLEQIVKVGALYGPLLEQGEWWRLLSSQFLHLGALHLGCNMLGLSFLGPMVENTIGTVRFFITYVVSGVGGMLIAWTLYTAGLADTPVILVGASASILGMVGVTAANSLIQYRRSGSPLAKAQLGTMVQIVVMQAVFDSLVPEVSSVAHLGGAATGFLVGLVLGYFDGRRGGAVVYR
jgi:membrane associated rhomboid family serine protease